MFTVVSKLVALGVEVLARRDLLEATDVINNGGVVGDRGAA